MILLNLLTSYENCEFLVFEILVAFFSSVPKVGLFLQRNSLRIGKNFLYVRITVL